MEYLLNVEKTNFNFCFYINENFCSKCGTKVKKENEIVVQESTESIVSEPASEKILSFLDKAIILETRKYGLEKALNELNSDIAENSIETVSKKLSKTKMKDYKNPFLNVILSFIFALGYIIFILTHRDWLTDTNKFFKFCVIGSIIFYVIYVLILFLLKTLNNKIIDRKQSKLDLDASNENKNKKLKLEELNMQLQTIEKEKKETEFNKKYLIILMNYLEQQEKLL